MTLPLHPLLVHLPIALAILMPVLAIILWFAIRRTWLPARAWTLAVGAQFLLVVSGFVAMRSGEADEERIEHRVPEAAIERHEEAAERFVWAAVAVLGAAVVPLVLRGKPHAIRIGSAATVLGSLAVLALGYRVGHAGGELVYRHGAAAAYADSASGLPDAGTGNAASDGGSREAEEHEEH